MSVAPTSALLRTGWRQAWLSLTRERGWGTTFGVFFLVLLLLQLLLLFTLTVTGINQLLVLRAGLHIDVLSSARDEDIQQLYADMQALPIIDHLQYIPKDKALDIEKTKNPDLVSFLKQYKLDNPFPDSFVVTLKSVNDYASFSQFLQQTKEKSVIDPSFLSQMTDQEQNLAGIVQLAASLTLLSYLFAGLTALLVFFLLLEHMRRRLETSGEDALLGQVLGAPPVSIVSPLAFRATILTMLSLFIATVIAGAFIASLPYIVPSGSQDIFTQLEASVEPLALVFIPAALLAEIIILPILCFIAASLSIRRLPLGPS